MKNLIIILILSFLFACGSGASSSSSSSASSDTEQEQKTSGDSTGDTVPEESHEPGPVKLAIDTGSNIIFYDGTEFYEKGQLKKCGSRCFFSGSYKYQYDDMGEIESSEYLGIEPDFIAGDYMTQNIDPQTALSMGAQARDYTRIFYQGSEQGQWFENRFKTESLFKTGDEIVLQESGKYKVLTANFDKINNAHGLIIYDFDPVGRTASINYTSVNWSTNYFNQADKWINFGDVWYSWNGYEFDQDLTEQVNNLWLWNTGNYPVQTDSPVVIIAGIYQDWIYFIECSSGWLVRFNPEFDQVQPAFRLYLGDGQRLSGIDKSLSLKPVIIDYKLYFSADGIRELDLRNGITNLFYGVNGEVLGW
jgi:hypothetical protein